MSVLSRYNMCKRVILYPHLPRRRLINRNRRLFCLCIFDFLQHIFMDNDDSSLVQPGTLSYPGAHSGSTDPFLSSSSESYIQAIVREYSLTLTTMLQ